MTVEMNGKGEITHVNGEEVANDEGKVIVTFTQDEFVSYVHHLKKYEDLENRLNVKELENAGLREKQADRDKSLIFANEVVDRLFQFYGKNYEISGYHLNGAMEPFDNLIDGQFNRFDFEELDRVISEIKAEGK